MPVIPCHRVGVKGGRAISIRLCYAFAMNRLFACLLGALFVTQAHAEDAQTIWPDCYCTDKTGQRLELGDIVCMSVGGRDFMARCEMSLNNPMWREVSGACLSSQLLPQTRKQGFHTFAINANI